MNDYLDGIHRDYTWLISFTDAVIDARPDRLKLIDEKYTRLNRIVAFYLEGAPRFVDYLRLDMKIRYFWPFPPLKIIRDVETEPTTKSGIRGILRRWRKNMLKSKSRS